MLLTLDLALFQGFACCGQTMGNYACRQCWMSKHDGAVSPFGSGQARTAAHNAAHRQAAVDSNVSKTQKEAAMAAVSIKDVDNGFADIWFGANGMGELLIKPLAMMLPIFFIVSVAD